MIYLYVIVRDKLSGGSLLSQFGHACSEAITPEFCPFPKDAVIRILCATKARMDATIAALTSAGVVHAPVLETDGPMAGVTTAVGFVVSDLEKVPRVISDLKPARFERISKEMA